MGKDYKITEVCVSCSGSVPLQADIIAWVTWILEVKHWIVRDKFIQFHIPIYVHFNFTIRTSPGECHVTPYIGVHDAAERNKRSQQVTKPDRLSRGLVNH